MRDSGGTRCSETVGREGAEDVVAWWGRTVVRIPFCAQREYRSVLSNRDRHTEREQIWREKDRELAVVCRSTKIRRERASL